MPRLTPPIRKVNHIMNAKPNRRALSRAGLSTLAL
ncbi:MAG: hypothetical protein ACJAZN_002515, partial [Planctomycetota bacterium]